MSNEIANYSFLNDAQLAIVNQITPKKLVRRRNGKAGKIFDYLPHEEVTRMLNSAFNHGWNTEIKQFGIIEGVESWVLMRMEIITPKGIIRKEQFGTQEFLKNRNNEIVMTTGDCLKGAASDALTKCASLIGIALDLFGVSSEDVRKAAEEEAAAVRTAEAKTAKQPEQPSKSEPKPPQSKAAQETAKPSDPQQPEAAEDPKSPYITRKQQSRLWAIARESGCSNDNVKDILAVFGLDSTGMIRKEVTYDAVIQKIRDFHVECRECHAKTTILNIHGWRGLLSGKGMPPTHICPACLSKPSKPPEPPPTDTLIGTPDEMRERAKEIRKAAQYTDDPNCFRAEIAEAEKLEHEAARLERETKEPDDILI